MSDLSRYPDLAAAMKNELARTSCRNCQRSAVVQKYRALATARDKIAPKQRPVQPPQQHVRRPG